MLDTIYLDVQVGPYNNPRAVAFKSGEDGIYVDHVFVLKDESAANTTEGSIYILADLLSAAYPNSTFAIYKTDIPVKNTTTDIAAVLAFIHQLRTAT